MWSPLKVWEMKPELYPSFCLPLTCDLGGKIGWQSGFGFLISQGHGSQEHGRGYPWEVPKTFLESSRSQNYFQNNTKTQLLISTPFSYECTVGCPRGDLANPQLPLKARKTLLLLPATWLCQPRFPSHTLPETQHNRRNGWATTRPQLSSTKQIRDPQKYKTMAFSLNFFYFGKAIFFSLKYSTYLNM